MLKYSIYRLGLFLVVTLVLLLIGVPELWAVVFGALFSMVTSLFVLAGPREEAARKIEARLEEKRARRAEALDDQRTDEEVEDQDYR
ncbi:DUF4229 domain-containing protein [Ornithinimicrobium ciconiae]|uniref:DUF4229 domain-containing protein n=1 Tax=Ornithinimicrobium ciconiae TaxID=2594265 RepID=UPI0013FCF914|nr:DUF4229 domain-containing protein [Ornithinimicrobium ciconiae]